MIADLHHNGYCILKSHFSRSAIEKCRQAFWPILVDYIRQNRDNPNRGPHRHFLPMPFDPPCFAPEFFFDPAILAIVNAVLGERVAADQWGCDAPVKGSQHQEFHVDYRQPLFAESPDLPLPAYMLVVSFGLVDITLENGPIEIVPGTHHMPRADALHAVAEGAIRTHPLTLSIGDVLIRHPWALHRGTPNRTDAPRPLLTIRYVRRWYADYSRDVHPIPLSVWQSLSTAQQEIMRFPPLLRSPM